MNYMTAKIETTKAREEDKAKHLKQLDNYNWDLFTIGTNQVFSCSP